MTLERTMLGGVCILTPKRNLTGGDETRDLTNAVDAITADGATKVVIDLGRITWVNSMGLASLQRVRLICSGRGIPFALACVGGRIKSLMLTTRLVILFDTYESLDEALASHESASAS